MSVCVCVCPQLPRVWKHVRLLDLRRCTFLIELTVIYVSFVQRPEQNVPDPDCPRKRVLFLLSSSRLWGVCVYRVKSMAPGVDMSQRLCCFGNQRARQPG